MKTIRDEYDNAKVRCDQVTARDLTKFADEIAARPSVPSPAIVNSYMASLSTIFCNAKALWQPLQCDGLHESNFLGKMNEEILNEDEQIHRGSDHAILRQIESDVPVGNLCRERAMSNASFCKWRAQHGGMDASAMNQLRDIAR